MYKQAIETHREYGNWYRDCHSWIYGNFRYPALFAGLLAATSPRKQVKANFRLAMRLYARHLSGRFVDYSELLPAARGNVRVILSGRELSGLKVKAFYANLTGDYQQVTIDVWMLRFYGFAGWITPNRYKMFARRVQNYALKAGLKPAELQAIIWNYERSKAGLKPTDFVSVATENQMLLF